MTTPNTPEVTDTVRRCVTAWETTRPEHRTLADAEELMQALRDALPTPPRPTLADMPPEERAACDWMQADVEALDGPWLIIDPAAADHAHVVDREGKNRLFPARYVTPRPDLPRWEWPGEQQPAPALALPDGWKLADHEKYGRVIVTSDTPDTDGHVYFVAPAPCTIGNDWHLCRNDELAYLDNDQEDDQ